MMMARANNDNDRRDDDDPWAIPTDLKSRRNVIEKTQKLSLNDRTGADDVGGSNSNRQRPQTFGGFTVPKPISGSVFGGGGGDNRSSSRNRQDIGGGGGCSSASSSGEKPFNSLSNSFGGFTSRGRGNVFPGGADPPGGGAFGISQSTAAPGAPVSMFRRNLLSENSNKSYSMNDANSAYVEQRNMPQFGGGGGGRWKDRKYISGDLYSEEENSNRSFGGFSSVAPFSNRNSNEGPTSSQQSLSMEEREKIFWAQQASRSTTAALHPQTLTNPSSSVRTAPGGLGGFTPPLGRPLFGRGLNGNERGKGHGNMTPHSRPLPQQHTPLLNSANRTSQEGGYEKNVWFPKDEIEKPMPNEEISLLNKILHKKLENLQNGNLEISQARSDPNSPLYSVTSFQSLRLKDELLRALDKMGFHMPSKIQEAALPLLLIEPPLNMIAQAQSGTGKTAAFVLTMLSRVVPENKWPQCLCLAPTYELAMQIGQVVQKMGEFLPEIKIRYVVKGEKLARGEKIEEQILIGTPGKMLDWVIKFKLVDSSKIICLVLDEADVMIAQQGHQDQSVRLHHELQQAGAKYQSLLFSATYDENVRTFADSIIRDAVNITLRRDEQTLKNIKQYYVKCANRDEKYEAVMNLYGGLTIASAIIFCYTRKSAEWLAARMSQRGHDVTVLHGEMAIEDRARTIQQFKDSVFKVLITTNVCARGIDVCQVSVVINYDPPVTYSDDPQPDYETYIHRIGRTGRFGKAGIAINLVSDEFALRVIQRIGEYFGVAIEPLDTSDMDQLEAIDNDNKY